MKEFIELEGENYRKTIIFTSKINGLVDCSFNADGKRYERCDILLSGIKHVTVNHSVEDVLKKMY